MGAGPADDALRRAILTGPAAGLIAPWLTTQDEPRLQEAAVLDPTEG